ncbi:DNA-binding protein WhiA [Gleimia sp. 6138-11-ORH1]|uniref:DNA-binding protein WhiA n=1 Tax=Gleimia sp. 6138-11-ORH1 TaxID=2973937 RepID=UPI00216A327D|nr:DNA-binding protein WhiA [Gleimia sp. 6138-11-ORH1]MCS4484322.1 DNA-binding protein WhiA [Gleimia sp. 6138-11-ORH1]
MALTAGLKKELVQHPVTTASQMNAEIATLLRFAGGLHEVNGHVVIEAELDSKAAATRLRAFLAKLYNASTSVVVVSGGALKKGDRYVVRVVERAEQLARLTGLVDHRNQAIRGLPPEIVSGGEAEAIAAWRGAFLARGSLLEPGRSSSMELTAPGPEAALALVGVARRMGATARVREVRNSHRVVVKDADGISVLLDKLGAKETFEIWNSRRQRRELRGNINRLANFDDANLRRSARAAVAAGARVQRAFEILGDDIPAHLYEAGQLRLQYKEASLEELGKLSDPQLTKDAVAGRIRRLLALADKVASEQGIADTEAAITMEMLDES